MERKEGSIKRIVFLCTGNSCRSQMAEGFARHYGGELPEVYSFGTSPVGVNPKAIEVMKEAGVDISGHTSDPIDMDIINGADILITLCGDASCPYVPGNVVKIHWPLEDPAAARGSEQEILGQFRKTRDKTKRLVKELVEEITNSKKGGV